MPRLSLYRPNRTRDYQFLDRTIREMYTVGGVDIYVHKYMGPETGGKTPHSVAMQMLLNLFMMNWVH